MTENTAQIAKAPEADGRTGSGPEAAAGQKHTSERSMARRLKRNQDADPGALILNLGESTDRPKGRLRNMAANLRGPKVLSAEDQAYLDANPTVQQKVQERKEVYFEGKLKKLKPKAVVRETQRIINESKEQAAADKLATNVNAFLRGEAPPAAGPNSSTTESQTGSDHLTIIDAEDIPDNAVEQLLATPQAADLNAAQQEAGNPEAILPEDIPSSSDALLANIDNAPDQPRKEPGLNAASVEPGSEAAILGETATARTEPTATLTGETGDSPAATGPETANTTKSGKTEAAVDDEENKKPTTQELLKELGYSKDVTKFLGDLGAEGNEAVAEKFNERLSALKDINDAFNNADKLDMGLERPDMKDLITQLKNKYNKEMGNEVSDSKIKAMLKMIWEVLSDVAIELAKEAALGFIEGAAEGMSNTNK